MNALPAPHVPDGALLRLVDDALEDDERASVAAHVDACPSCVERARRYRALSGGWTRVLEVADDVWAAERDEHVAAPELRGPTAVRSVPETSARTDAAGTTEAPPTEAGTTSAGVTPLPTRRPRLSRAGWLRAAAILVALGLAATPGVRAGVAALWERLVAGPAPQAVEGPVEGAPGAPRSVSVGFAFARPLLTVAFEVPQASGDVVVVRSAADADVRARVEGGGDEELLVRPEGLRVRNEPGSTASYRVTVPATVSTVRIEVAGVEVASFRPAGDEVRIPLGGR